MTRPLAVSGLSLFFVMLVLSFLPNSRLVVWAGAAFFVLFLCSLLLSKQRHFSALPLVFFSALFGCLLFLSFCAFWRAPALQLADTRAVLLCEACDYPTPNSTGKRLLVTAKVTLDDGTRVPGKVRLTLPRGETADGTAVSEIAPGDTLRFTGRLYALGGDNADVVRSFQSRGMFLGAYPVLKLSIEKASSPSLYQRLLRWRQRLIHTLNRWFDRERASLLTAVLFGEKSTMPSALYTAFRRAGAAHIMAVSGLHLSAWIFFLLSLWKRKTQDLRRAGVVLSGVVVVLMALAAFSGSVLRAGLMMLVFLFGLVLRRNADGLNSLGLACLLVLTVRPAFCMHVGFTLSVLSTLAILVFALPLAEASQEKLDERVALPWLRAALHACVASVWISLCVTAVTLPVQLYAFGSVSLVTVVTNLLLLPVLLPLLVLAGCFLLLHDVPLLGALLRILTDATALYCTKIAKAMSALPFALWTVPREHAGLTAAVCAVPLLVLAVFALRRQRVDDFQKVRYNKI